MREIHRESLSYASSFAVERIHVVMEGGAAIDVLFKDLNPINQLKHARAVRELSLERSQRELAVYQRLLARYSFGTPRLLGCRWLPEFDRYWLFLEFIHGKKVSKMADRAVWAAAARWIARFHVEALRRLAADIDFLPLFDREHYSAIATIVAEKARRLNPDDRALLDDALAEYENVLERLRTFPHSPIHGEYFGKNVLARQDGDGWVIYGIDWETAAFGPSFLDIASLSSGDWNETERSAMRAAYHAEYCARSGTEVSWERFEEILRDLSLYQALRWIAWWPGTGVKPFDRWLRELRTIVPRSVRPSPRSHDSAAALHLPVP